MRKPRMVWCLCRCTLWAALVAATGCSVVSRGASFADRARSLVVEEIDLCVSIAPKANLQSAVAVELLFVYDDQILKQVAGMTAGDWFLQRIQFQRDFGGLYASHYWEWAPNPTPPTWSSDATPPPSVVAVRVPVRARRTRGAVLFANYLSPGEHRVPIELPELKRQLVLDLHEETFELSTDMNTVVCSPAARAASS